MAVCTPEGGLQLTNILNSTIAGPILMCINGTSGRVVDDDWTVDDAKVVCKQMGVSFGSKYQ